MEKVTGLDGCKRCPDCFKVPEPKVITKIYGDGVEVELRCEQHGHAALGDTVEQAVYHWNIYIEFTERLRADQKKEKAS